MQKIASLSFLLLLSFGLTRAQGIRPEAPKKFPGLVTLEQALPASQRQTAFEQNLDFSEGDELRSMEVFQDQLGFTHEKFQQYYQGIKVEGATYTAHMKNGSIKLLSGYFADIKDVSVTPGISESTALSTALGYVGATRYMWQESAQTGQSTGEMPQGELVLLPDMDGRAPARLAWKFDIYAVEPLYRAYVFIDATNGQFITEHARIHHTNVAASGASLYNGTVTFTADQTAATSFRLRQTAMGSGIETYSLNNGTNYTAATDITSTSSTFTGKATGVQAHYGAEQTYLYYLNAHGRNSYNGTGGVLRSYVSYSNNYVNAYWDGTRMTYGDGNGTSYGPLVSLDITGHEISHGVTEYSANLVYQRESGALNESFSDIFGEMVEYTALQALNGGTNDWLMGDDIGIGGSGALRSMSNPGLYGDPDTYGGANWGTPNCGTPTQSNDYCYVHSNSGVQNKWFYVLAMGESGTNDIGSVYSVTGIGRTKAAAIAYRNLTVYLSSSSTFANARAGSIQAAIDLYGAGSAEEIATTNAWYAVGVGNEYGNTSVSYCTSNGTNVNDEYIQRVQLNTIDNASGSGGGYSNHTNISTDLTKNTSYTITITPRWTATVYPEGYSVWIDYNQDGDFADAGEQVASQAATTATPISKSFTVPSTATDGPTRMRVSMKYNGIPTSCESFTYGEVEDYTVNIGNGGGADTQAPTAPTGLSASGTTQTTTSLTWNASTDNVGVTGYKVYLNGTSIGTVTGTAANVTGLTASTTYSFYVTALDAAANESGASNTVNVTTQSAADTQAPTAPSGLAASNITQTSADLSWTASTDNVGVDHYNVYVGGVLNGTSATTSYALSGLTASTTYSVYVTASDAAGNTSGQSNTINVTTLSAGGGGTTTISASYFETGWDDWNDGGSDCARYAGTRSYEGTYSIYIRDNSGVASSMTTNAFNLSGYASVEVDFYFYVVSMENNEDFWLQYNDGSGWQTVATYVRGVNINNNTFYHSTITLNAGTYTFNNSGQFRFRCDASDNSDLIYIDQVTITGTSPAVAAVASASGVGFELEEVGGLNETAGFTTTTDFEGDLQLYPMPATDYLNVAAADEIVSVSVYTMEGKLVMKADAAQLKNGLNVSNLSAGVYLITVNTVEEVLNSKFIKE
ncbi:MAG: M4 family metallopeptidase [Bacteroidia bacterium]